jgi:ribonuclease HI
MTDKHVLTIHTDGAARGNPGPAAFAYVITGPVQPTVEEHGCLGETTNNVAEYTALVKALQRARDLGGRRLTVHSDSELMVKQMLGQYKVKNDGLKALYDQARALVGHFDSVSLRHIRREQNRRADALCNEALDGAPKSSVKFQAKAAPASPATHAAGPRTFVPLPPGAREEILDCLRAVASVWSAGNPNHPRAEEVWDQLWTILEEAGVLRTRTH